MLSELREAAFSISDVRASATATPLWDALAACADLLDRGGAPGARRRILVLSDGADNGSP